MDLSIIRFQIIDETDERNHSATDKNNGEKADSDKEEKEETQKSPHQKISSEYLAKLIYQAEWAEVDATRTEVYLGLCWGDPLEYRYQWAKPKSGCDRIIASHTVPSSIKIQP